MFRGNNRSSNFLGYLRHLPVATANVIGSEYYPEIQGMVSFYQTPYGVLVLSEVYGLPKFEGFCEKPIFAFHIHEGSSCSGNVTDPFANVGMHYNPYNCLHPYHAGDMPPLLGVGGTAYSIFLTDSFTAEEIIGKTVIIHDMPDDFSTQPSGNAGGKIACGEIVATR